jgi:hypothetical protein
MFGNLRLLGCLLQNHIVNRHGKRSFNIWCLQSQPPTLFLKRALSEVEEEEFEQETADEVLDTVRNPSRVQRWGGAIYGNKWKILVGSLGTLIGAQPGLISEYLVLAAKGELDKIPPFNHFAANCVGAVKWPETQGWDLKSANLQGPLVIGGELTG